MGRVETVSKPLRGDSGVRLPASRWAGAGLGGAVLLVAGVALPAAAATTAHPAVLQSGWFGVHPEDQAGQSVPVNASGVPQGDLAVAYYGDSDTAPNKQTFVAWNLAQLPAKAHVSTFSVTLTVDLSAPTQSLTPPKLVACLPQGTWPAGANQDAARGEPPLDCSHSVAGVYSGGAYTFNVATYAQKWLNDVNVGIGIRNAPSSTTPFQIAFKGAPQIKATVDYVVATAKANHPITHASAPASTPSGSGTTSGGSTTSGPAAPPAGTVFPPSSSGTLTTTPAPGQQPQLAPTTPAAPTAGSPSTSSRHVAVAIQAGSRLPTTGFWVAGVLLALTLIAVSLAVGDVNPVDPARRRISRLDIVLRARRTQRSKRLVPAH